MATHPQPDFTAYFAAIRNNDKYRRWSNHYTSTDTVGKQREFFHMGLMVQAWQPKPKPGEEKREKGEPLGVLEGIRKYAQEHVLLVGRPGSGKSTALERLLWEESQRPLPQPLSEAERGESSPPSLIGKGVGGLGLIPVLVRLREYQTSVIDIITNFCAKHDLYLDQTEIENLLATGQLLLLMDGLNELPNELPHDTARREVAAFRKKYSRRTAMIFTTRDVSLGGDCGIEKKLEMQPLTEKQMREFVQAYLGNCSELFLRQLNERLRKFAETPLLLWMLCCVYDPAVGKIPTNLGEAFREFTQLYDNQLKSDVPGYENYRQWCGDLLQALALEMMQGTTRTELRLQISKQDAEDILTQFLEREQFDKPRDYAKRWLEDLLEHHLIATVGQQEIEFQHQLIQEYYAAKYLLRQLPKLSDAKLQRDYLNYLKWTETIALVLGLMEDEAQAVRVVRLALDVDLMLGARLTGEVKREFQEKTVGMVLGLEVRERLRAKFLGMTRSNYATSTLISILDSEDYYTISCAIGALKKIDTREAWDAMIFVILHNKDNDIRQKILLESASVGCYLGHESLEKTQINKTILFWLQLLQDKDLFIRDWASHVLQFSDIDDAEVVNALQEYKNSADYDIVIDSMYEEEIDDIWKEQNEAETYIYYINDIYVEYDKRVNDLITEVKSQNSFIREAAIPVLGTYRNNHRVIDTLISCLKSSKYNERNLAADALGKIDDERAVEALISSLCDECFYTRMISESDSEWLIHYMKDRISTALGNIASPHFIYKMWKMLLEGKHDNEDAIIKIQEKCQFYNHEIFHSPPVKEEASTDLLSNNQVINVYPQNLTMQESTNNLNFNAPIGAVNTGTVQVKGTLNQVGTQHNYALEQKQSLAEAAKEIQDLLGQLSQTYPTSTEAGKQLFIAKFDEQVSTNSRIRDMLLVGGIELIKILCPPLGIPIEMGKKWLETAERSQ